MVAVRNRFAQSIFKITLSAMPTITQIKQAIVVAEKIEALESQLAVIWGTTKLPSASKVITTEVAKTKKVAGTKAAKAGKVKRSMSPEAIEKIREGQRRRWAKFPKKK